MLKGRIFVKRLLMGAASISLAAAAVLSGAPMASAATDGVTAGSCSARYNAYDPEQGGGTAYSYCTADAPVSQHRVLIWCDGRGPYYGNWIAKGKFSTTACAGGERATFADLQFR
ncbi:hypothetical protein [Amycolatopsis sp. NPDC059657]|uniref:hypothetical protein n=1 Tax=Amycolatopsis sp. NPDC059657 TaxID=3346899 RepID=UPI00367268B2